MLKRTLQYLLLALLFLSASCTREDVEVCNPGVKLQYYYLLNSRNVNLFSDEVKKISVYVFDKDGLYYETYTDQGDNLTDDYVMDLPLKGGKYTIVSWGGYTDNYSVGHVPVTQSNVFQEGLDKGKTTLDSFRLVVKDANKYLSEANLQTKTNFQDGLRKGVTTLSEFRLKINAATQKADEPTDYVVANNIDDLYYGEPKEIDVQYDAVTSATIGLTKNTNLIKMTVTGVDYLESDNVGQTKAAPKVDVYCTSHNGSYKWDNTVDKNSKSIKYIPFNSNITNSIFVGDLRVLRLLIGNKVMLTVVDPITKEVIFNHDIVELIMKNPKYKIQQDIDRDDVFEFMCEIKPNHSVDITVNGWKIINVIPQL